METWVRLNSGFGFFVLFAAEVAKPLCPSGELWVCAKSPCVSTHTHAHTHTGREGGRAAPAKREGQPAAHQNARGKPRKLCENTPLGLFFYYYYFLFVCSLIREVGSSHYTGQMEQEKAVVQNLDMGSV